MKRYNNNGKAVWGSGRQDSYPPNRFGGRVPMMGGRRDQGGFQRPGMETSDFEARLVDDSPTKDPVSVKLDRILERFDKFDIWKDETDRRFENIKPYLSREAEPPPEFADGDEWEDDGNRWRNSGDRGTRSRNFPPGNCGGGMDNRGRRDNRSCAGFGGDQSYGYVPPGERPPSCWDPPQRFQAAGYEKPERVKMQPPRFDGTEAATWISKVQFYFNHLRMPEAQRLHYAVMLFDQPAAEWVFNYCSNNEFVTWQEFLEDVRHRFDRQSFRNFYGLIAKLTQTGTVLEYHDTFEKYMNRVKGVPKSDLFTLFVAGLKPDMQERLQRHRPSSLAAAMALALELADTQADRWHQPPQPTATRRPGQNRDGRGPTGVPPGQPPPQASGAVVQTQGGSGRPTVQMRPPMVRVSQAEKAERARMGLCYYCPDKWVIGHVCKQRLLCYAGEDGENNKLKSYSQEQEELRKQIVKSLEEGKSKGHGDVDVNISEEELKRLKSLKKKEIKVKLEKIREVAGIEGIFLDKDDLEAEFDPEAHDKKRNEAFGEEYYGAEDVDPQFGTDEDEDEKLHIDNVLWNALNMLSDDDKELPHGGFMKCLLATKTFNIGLNMPAKPVVFTNVQDFDGDYYDGRRLPIWRVFDPGGDASPKLLLPTIVVAS